MEKACYWDFLLPFWVFIYLICFYKVELIADKKKSEKPCQMDWIC